jgi:hypothetical protein
MERNDEICLVSTPFLMAALQPSVSPWATVPRFDRARSILKFATDFTPNALLLHCHTYPDGKWRREQGSELCLHTFLTSLCEGVYT